MRSVQNCCSKHRRGQKVNIEAASEASQEQDGSPVERAGWYVCLVVSRYTKVGYQCCGCTSYHGEKTVLQWSGNRCWRMRMCTDHQDASRANLKDEFLVRYNEVSVDYIARVSVFIFMDGFSAKTKLDCCQMIWSKPCPSHKGHLLVIRWCRSVSRRPVPSITGLGRLCFMIWFIVKANAMLMTWWQSPKQNRGIR